MKATVAKRPAWTVYAVLLSIVIFAALYSILFFIGPSAYGDDFFYINLSHAMAQGSFNELNTFDPLLSIRLLTIAPIALSFKLFGYSAASASLWDMLSFLGTIPLTFLIGRRLYNYVAGVVAAALVALMPLVVLFSTTVDDDIILMFVVTFALFAFLKGRGDRSRGWYFVSGALLVAGLLVSPQVVLFIVMLFAYIAEELVRRRLRLNRTSAYMLYGIVAAFVALSVFNYIDAGRPLITLTFNANFYLTPIPIFKGFFNFYTGLMFPYSVVNSLYSALSGHMSMLASIPYKMWAQNSLEGLFFYAVSVSAIFLLLARERRAYMPMVLVVGMLLYLNFGPSGVSFNPLSYIFLPRLERYLLLVVPLSAVIIGIAVARALKAGTTTRKAMALLVLIAFFVPFVSMSLKTNLYWYSYWAYTRDSQMAITQYLDSLPAGMNQIPVYYLMEYFYLYVPLYMHYDYPGGFYHYNPYGPCDAIPNNSFVAVPMHTTPDPTVNGTWLPSDPLGYCPDWRLVLNVTPDPSAMPENISNAAGSITTWALYYVPNATS